MVCEIFHIGHLRALKNAKRKGDYLIVGVCTDEAVKEKAKIFSMPESVIPFKERIQIVANIKCVDETVPQDTYSPLRNLKKIKPDVLMESSDHPDIFRKSREYVESYGGKVIINPYYKPQSVTKIKEKIREQRVRDD